MSLGDYLRRYFNSALESHAKLFPRNSLHSIPKPVTNHIKQPRRQSTIMFIDLDFPYRIADESSTHPFWRMNFNKYNKFKSHLDINDTSFFFAASRSEYECEFENGTDCEVFMRFWKIEESKKAEKRENILLPFQSGKFWDLWTGNGSAIGCKRWTINEIDGRLCFRINSGMNSADSRSPNCSPKEWKISNKGAELRTFNFQFPFVIKIRFSTEIKLSFPPHALTPLNRPPGVELS